MPHNLDLVRTAFHCVVGQIVPGDRASVLVYECGADRPLRDRVEFLLLPHDAAEGLIVRADIDARGPAAATVAEADRRTARHPS